MLRRRSRARGGEPVVAACLERVGAFVLLRVSTSSVVALTLPIREGRHGAPRARVLRLDPHGQPFDYAPGQAVLVGTHGQPKRRPYSIAAAPADMRRDGWLELLIGVESDGQPGDHLTLAPGALVDVEGPLGSFTFPAAPVERRFVFIAGGTGIAPLRAVLRPAPGVPHR